MYTEYFVHGDHAPEAIRQEGFDLWHRHVAPARAELCGDLEFLSELEEHGLGHLLRSRGGWLNPWVPWELLSETHFPSDLLLHYASWIELGLPGILQPVRRGAARRLPDSWCDHCGRCCLEMTRNLRIVPQDRARLFFFLENACGGMGAVAAHEVTDRVVRTWIGAAPAGGWGTHLLACPFLVRIDSVRATCTVYPARPEVCKAFSPAQCRRFLEYRPGWLARRNVLLLKEAV
jgi:Fe-S-cluster containining protein